MESQLLFNRSGAPPFSARGCKQELKPVQQGKSVRLLSGELVFLGADAQKIKYTTTITGKDHAPFAFDGLYPGCAMEVGCISPIVQRFTNSTINLSRPFVENSLRAVTQTGETITILSVDKKKVVVEEDVVGYISYRPWLSMRVIDFSTHTDEWSMDNQWVLKLEEI